LQKKLTSEPFLHSKTLTAIFKWSNNGETKKMILLYTWH